jgi:hypothetical protein
MAVLPFLFVVQAFERVDKQRLSRNWAGENIWAMAAERGDFHPARPDVIQRGRILSGRTGQTLQGPQCAGREGAYRTGQPMIPLEICGRPV